MIKALSAIIFSILLMTSIARADHGKGVVGGKTLSPRTLSEGRGAVEFGFRYQGSETLSDAVITAGTLAGSDVHSVEWGMEFTLAGAYGVTDRLSVSLSIPYVILHGFRAGEDDGMGGVEIVTAGAIEGLGDLTLLAKHSLPVEPVELAILVGLKMPTGSLTENDDLGNRLEIDHQPGTGSWDPLLGVAFAQHFDGFTLGASVLYRITVAGQQDFKPGETVLVGLRGEVQVLGLGEFPRLYFSMELTTQFVAHDATAGVLNADSGGWIVAVGPGVRLRLAESLTISLTVSVPVYQGLNGLQHEERVEVLLGAAVDL